MRGNIDSITLNDIAVEIALKEDSKEEYKDFFVDLAIIRSVFPDTLQVRVEDLENYLLQKLPILVVTTNCSTIECTKHAPD